MLDFFLKSPYNQPMKTEVLDLIKKNANLTPADLVKMTEDPREAGIALRSLIVAGVVNVNEDWELSVASNPQYEQSYFDNSKVDSDSDDE